MLIQPIKGVGYRQFGLRAYFFSKDYFCHKNIVHIYVALQNERMLELTMKINSITIYNYVHII